MKLVLTLAGIALSTALTPAHTYAYSVYDRTCAQPAAPNHVWYIDPVKGDTPDAAHGGIVRATDGLMGTADGSATHPFNSFKGVFVGGKVTPVPGYAYPLLSTAPYDHYGMGTGLGVHGQRRDDDWNPAAPVATRINPGDAIVLESGTYGDLAISYYGVATSNVDASGKTAFVTIEADAGATPMFWTLSISGARGFVLDGITVKSDKSYGANVNGGHIATINGSSVAGQTKDIIVANSTFESWSSFADANTAWNTEDPNHTTYANLELFMRGEMRWDLMAAGDDQPGVDSSCIAIENSHIRMTYSAFFVANTSKTLFTHNELDHYGNDAIDMSASNFATTWNFIHDPLNLGDGAHPDGHQSQISASYPGPFNNVLIDHDDVYERLDAINPYMQNTTWGQIGRGSNWTVTNNIGETSNCPGMAFVYLYNSTIANNTMIGNGEVLAKTCPQSGEIGTTANSGGNVWASNVTAGRFYQACNNSTWINNIQLPIRSGGVSTPEVLSYCDPMTRTLKVAFRNGTYNGVRIITTDSPTFAFTHYDPPTNGVTSVFDPNLLPAAGGPLARRAASRNPSGRLQ